MEWRGAMTREDIGDFKPLVKCCDSGAGIWGEVVDNSEGDVHDAPRLPALLVLNASAYELAEGEAFDGEAWEDSSATIYAPATRGNWALCYRLARRLLKGPVYLDQEQLMRLGPVINLNC